MAILVIVLQPWDPSLKNQDQDWRQRSTMALESFSSQEQIHLITKNVRTRFLLCWYSDWTRPVPGISVANDSDLYASNIFHFISVTWGVCDPVFECRSSRGPRIACSFLTFAWTHFDVSADIAMFSSDTNEDGWWLPARQDEAWNIPDTNAAILDWADASCTRVHLPLQVLLVFFPQNQRDSKHISPPMRVSIMAGLDWLKI